jgi:hypothetical protein
MNVYMSGTRVRSIASFVSADGVAADPTTTTFKYQAGTQAVTTITTPIHDGTGAFHYDIDTTGWAGPDNVLYKCEWIGTGNVQAISTDYFQVEAPAL